MTITPPSVSPQPDAPINAPGYAIAPNAVLRDARLSRDARLLYVLLDGHAGANGRVRVGDATVAAELNASESSFYRWSKELQDAGLITRKGTGRSAITIVHNGSRLKSSMPAEKPQQTLSAATADSPELSRVTALQRSNSLEENNNRGASPAEGGAAPAPTETPAAGGHAEELLLDAVRAATGAPVEMTRPVRRHLQSVAARGTTPNELAVEVAAWLAVKGEENIYRLAGFIAGVVLPSIASGAPTPLPEPTITAPMPPTRAELELLDAKRREWEQEHEAAGTARSEIVDGLLVLADQYGIESPVPGVAACRAALRAPKEIPA